MLTTSSDGTPATGGVLLVHAHPDDETIATGATIARLAAEGVPVTLVTLTLGEEGEVIPAELKHLEGDAPALAAHRRAELDAACEALGLDDHRVLGAWRDSGMAGVASNDHPDCLHQAPLDDVAAAIADVLREVRPAIVVTYDSDGGYGHPDHVKAHHATVRAIASVAPEHRVRKLQWCVFPSPDRTPPENTEWLDGSAYLDAKRAAMRAHRTQITLLDDDTFALSDGIARPLTGLEGRIRARIQELA